MSGFHGAFATGVACQQGTLTLPDTWFRPPLWDLLVLQLLRPDLSNLPCLYSTFDLEYPLVLSRFCFRQSPFQNAIILSFNNRPVDAFVIQNQCSTKKSDKRMRHNRPIMKIYRNNFIWAKKYTEVNNSSVALYTSL